MSEVMQAPMTDADYKAEAERISQEIDALLARMGARDIEAERLKAQAATLKAETRAIAARTEAKLALLERQVRGLSVAA